MIKDYRPILRSDVGALAIERRGIMRIPEHVQQLLVRDFLWIELDLDDLGVAGFVSTDLFVRGLRLFPASVTARHRLDAVQPFKHRLQTPETAAAKGG